MTMDRLPVELVTMVCSFLPRSDVANLRCTSKFNAEAGRPFMFCQLHLVFTPKSFERLHAISSNPALAPYVTSLYYEGDTLPFYDSFYQWQRHALSPTASSGSGFVEPPNQNSSSEHALRAYRRELAKSHSIAYQKYLEYSEHQDVMCADDYHAEKIVKAMACLPNLEEIVLSLECWAGGPSKAVRCAYSDSLITPYGDESWAEEPRGVPQMLSLLQGSARTQKKLKILHAGVVDWKFFEQSDAEFEDTKKAVQNLQELRLELSARPSVQKPVNTLSWTGHLCLGLEVMQCAQHLWRNERLRKFLAAAPNLRLLDVRFDLKVSRGLPSCIVDLRSVVGTHQWERLADVTLSSFNSREQDIVGFCERHAMTLQKLVINEIWLLQGSWLSTYQKMRRLLHLKEAKVRGHTAAYDPLNENWDFPSMESPDESPMSRVVQEYLLQGGDGPLLDLSEYDD